MFYHRIYYRNKIRKTFIYPIHSSIIKHFHIGIISDLWNLILNRTCFMWDAYSALQRKYKYDEKKHVCFFPDSDTCDMCYLKYTHEQFPFIDMCTDATLKFNEISIKSKYVYIVYDESNKVDKVKGTDIKSYIQRKRDVAFVDSEWKWIYIRSHEEGIKGFDVGPFFYLLSDKI